MKNIYGYAAALLAMIMAIAGLTGCGAYSSWVESSAVEFGSEVSVDDTAIDDGLVVATFSSVVDGDTIRVLVDGTELKVRLIGVDCPESVHSDSSKNSEEGLEASAYTKALLADVTTLYLEYDEDPQDVYGREMADVWLSADTSDINNMLNAILVRDGYAIDKVYEPNHKYATTFATLSAAAAEEGLGLWPTGVWD